MYKEYRIGATILMAGIGQRIKTEIPKQFLKLGNKKIYIHTLDVFFGTEIFDEIVLVCHKDYLNMVEEEIYRNNLREKPTPPKTDSSSCFGIHTTV